MTEKKATKAFRKTSRIDMREELVGILADLRAKRITPQAAKEAANLIGKAWAGERLALDYYAARKEKPPRFSFLDVATKDGA